MDPVINPGASSSEASGASADPALAAVRAEIVAEVEARAGAVAPSLRPLTLNTRNPLYPPSAALQAKLEARVQAGYRVEGDDYPSSRVWSRVVVPAIAVGVLDLPVVLGAAIAAAFHVHRATWLLVAALAVLVGAGAVALGAAIPALRDPLRLTTAQRRELNQARSWQSRQPWMGPRASTAEYRLLTIAHATVARLAESPAWGSAYLDEHRLRLNLAHELDGIDLQACQLATVRETRGADAAIERTVESAYSMLLDRVARLRHYADGVTALAPHVHGLEAAAMARSLDNHAGQLATGGALDQFAAEHVRTLTEDLQRMTATSFASSRANAT